MRHSVSPGHDKLFFSNTARKSRDINLRPLSMRGGIRL